MSLPQWITEGGSVRNLNLACPVSAAGGKTESDPQAEHTQLTTEGWKKFKKGNYFKVRSFQIIHGGESRL